jgi:uncharacterized protein
MTTLTYNNFTFQDKNDKVRVLFLKIYYFYLNKNELKKLGLTLVQRHSLEFSSDKKEGNIKQKFEFLLSKGFDNMVSTINNKPALYIHKNSGIPLLGSGDFGIIDRGTNTIEVKPITTCNIDCIFCSVDHDKRNSDIIVEADYLVEELNKVIELKENKVNIHIGSQGDPSLYGDLVRLVRLIRQNKQVNAISMVTNGLLITPTIAKELINAGMTHFHVSLHSLDEEKADELANTKYPVKKIVKLCKYLVKHSHLLIVPVWVHSINDKDIIDVIKFSKEIGADIGIQNFLEYKFGKHPANPVPMKVFFAKLKELEDKLDINLTTLTSELEFKVDTKLSKPFRKTDIVKVEVKAKSRMRNSYICVAKDRVITLINCSNPKHNVKVRLIRDKDNIFTGVPA